MKDHNMIAFVFLALGLLFHAGCTQSTTPTDTGLDDNLPPPVEDECGAVKAAAFPIINGTSAPNPAVVNLSASQQNAVGALIMNYGEAECTGTLVAPNVAVTAAHCLALAGGVRSVEFYLGQDYYAPVAIFGASEWHYHPSYSGRPPDYDVGVVILRGDPMAYGATPIPINCSSTSLVGRTIQAVGYGLTWPVTGENSQRWWTTLPVTRERSGYYQTTSSSTGTCEGDSGGPMLYTMSDGVVRVMGVVSSGDDPNCLGSTYWPRTDAYCGFLSGYIPVDPCAGETYQGRCGGSTAIWCESGSIRSQDCAATGYICDLDGSGNYRCVPPPDPCAGETYQGRCEGGTAVWCDLNRVIRVDCTSMGYDCVLNGEGYYRCVPRTDPCAGETFAGRCEGSTAVWCESSTVMRSDCSLTGQVCMQDVSGNWRCVTPGDPCLGETFEGRCDGNTAIWCEAGAVQILTCPEATLCGDPGDGLYRCVDECLLNDRAGRCDEYGRAVWCEEGVRRVRDCGFCNQLCGWVDDVMGNYCY
jgi:V8-like Glu-specific endopeptidase